MAMLLYVHVQVARLSESLATVFTHVRFLSGVSVNMDLELKSKRKKRLTIGALELLFRLNTFPFHSLLSVELRMNT